MVNISFIQPECAGNPFCGRLNAQTRACLCQTGIPVRYQARQIIEIDPCQNNKILLVRKGRVIPVRQRTNGKQKGIEYLGEGEIWGITHLFSPVRPVTNITAQAKTVLEGCLFPVAHFEELCLKHLDLARLVMSQLSCRFASVINQLEHMTLDSGEEKILYLLDLLTSINSQSLPFTHEEIALLAGVNRVTVTRVLDRLKQLGVIVTGRGELRVSK